MVANGRPESIQSRVTFDEIEGFRITVPVDVGCGEALTLLGGLACWGLLELIILAPLLSSSYRHNMVSGPIAAHALAALVWTAAGCAFAFWIVPWRGRRQVISIDADELVIRHEGMLGDHASSFSLARIRNLRYSPPAGVTYGLTAESRAVLPFAGNLAFDYDEGTNRFGPGLSENECRRLIRTIKDRYKIMDDKDEPLPVERL